MMSFYFIAIPIPYSLKNKLAQIQQTFKGKLPYKEWTYIDDFHITLKFLGPIEKHKLSHLKKSLNQLSNIQAFHVNICSIQTFGERTPRVLWVGADKNEEIVTLYENIQEICENLGFSKENRALQPHITLGKKWNGPPGFDLIQKLVKDSHFKWILSVSEVVLYQINPSNLPKYTIVQKFPLHGGEDDCSIN